MISHKVMSRWRSAFGEREAGRDNGLYCSEREQPNPTLGSLLLKRTNRQTDKQTNRQTDKQTNRQTDKQTNRQRDNGLYCSEREHPNPTLGYPLIKRTNGQQGKQRNRQWDIL